jgi:hypothetical protein
MKPNNRFSADFVRDRLSYNPDDGVVRWRYKVAQCVNAGDIVGSVSNGGYLRFSITYKNQLVHRVAWLIYYGSWPEGEIDHINGVKTDNRIKNLRDVSKSVNLQNQRKAYRSNSTGKAGACFNKKAGRYCAKIQVDKKRYWLGFFDSAESAHAAYMEAKRELHPSAFDGGLSVEEAEQLAKVEHPCRHL